MGEHQTRGGLKGLGIRGAILEMLGEAWLHGLVLRGKREQKSLKKKPPLPRQDR